MPTSPAPINVSTAPTPMPVVGSRDGHNGATASAGGISIDINDTSRALDLAVRPFKRSARPRSIFCGISVSPSQSSWAFRLENAMRFTVAAALSCSLICIPPMNQQSLPYVIAAFALLAAQPTFGSTIQTCIVTSAGGIIVAVMTALIQALYIHQSAIAMGFAIFIVCTLIGYFIRIPGTLRTALSLTVVWFLKVLNNSQPNYYFAFNIITLMLCGNLVSIIASILPFPHFASYEIDDKFFYGCIHTSHVFYLQMLMFTRQSVISANMCQQQANVAHNNIKLGLIAMRARLAETAYEPRYILDLLHEGNSSRLGSFTPKNLVNHLHHFSSILQTIQDSLNSIDYDKIYHITYVHYMSQSLMNLAETIHLFLESIADCSINRSVASQQQERMLIAWQQVQKHFHSARRIVHDYHQMPPSKRRHNAKQRKTRLAAQQEAAKHKTTTTTVEAVQEDETTSSMEPLLSPNAAATVAAIDYGKETILPSLSSTNSIHNDHQPLSPTNAQQQQQQQRNASLSDGISTNAITVSTRDLFLLNSFMFEIEQFVRVLREIDCSNNIINNNNNNNDDDDEGEYHYQQGNTHLSTWNNLYYNFNYHNLLSSWWPYWYTCFSLKSWILYYHWDLNQFKQSLKIGLAMTLGSVLTLIPTTATRFDNAFWISLTIGFIQSFNTGALTLTCVARLIGTLFGCSAAYLIDQAVGHENFFAIVPLIALWAGICGYARSATTTWMYAAVIASFAPIVILFGIQNSDQTSVGAYAFVRIQETILGIIIAIVVGTVLWPIEPSSLIREELIGVLKACQKGMSVIFDKYEQQLLSRTTTTTITDNNSSKKHVQTTLSTIIGTHSMTIATSLTKQSILIDDSQFQINIWNRSFPFLYYPVILQHQEIIWRLLLMMDRALISLLIARDKVSHNSHNNNSNNNNNNDNDDNNMNNATKVITLHSKYFGSLREQVPSAVEMILHSVTTDTVVFTQRFPTTFTSASLSSPRLLHDNNNSNNNSNDDNSNNQSVMTRCFDGLRQIFGWSSTSSLSALPINELAQRESDISLTALLHLHETIKSIDDEYRQWVEHIARSYRLAQLPMPTNQLISSVHAFSYSATELITRLIETAQSIKTLLRMQQPHPFDY